MRRGRVGMNKKVVSASFLSILLFLVMLGTVFMILVRAQDPEGTLALYPNEIYVVTGKETAVLPHWPDLNLTVELTNVTNCVAVAFSIQWDPTYFACTCARAVRGDFLEGNPGGTYWSIPSIDDVEGKLHEAAYTQLSPYAPQTLSDPTWGLVATLSFTYIGPTPGLAEWITTSINITNYDTGATMRTYWVDGGQNDFSETFSCFFYYEWSWDTHPLARFTYSPATVFVGDLVSFDASTSKMGMDGDHWCPITEYWWDFDDGNATMDIDPYITHAFTDTGRYHVGLYVVAPGIPPFIDPAYDNTSNWFFLDVVIQAGTPVGGIYIPVNKLALLAPYIALAITIIVATVAAATFIKHKKRQ